MGDFYYPAYIKKHFSLAEYMGCIWTVSGYYEYHEIAMNPETPERRREIMLQRIEGIEKAAESLPEEYRQDILNRIISKHSIPSRDKKLHGAIVKFLTEIRDNVLYLGY